LVLDAVIGAATPSASASISADGFLQVTVANGAVGTSINWTLDIQLTHSIQQAKDALPGAYIAVVNGAGVGGGISGLTIHQAYDFGAVAANQTIVINDTTKGGAVIIDASTAAVTGAATSSFEVRQNALHAVPMVISRRIGGQAPGPNLQFSRARGTYAAPAAVANDDELGTLDFYGYPVNTFTLDARIVSTVEVAAPTYATALQFYVTARGGALARAARLDMNGVGSNTTLLLYNNPDVEPGVDHTGRLGESTNRWGSIHVDTVHAYSNVCLKGAVVGGGATGTVLLLNTATMPVPQANQVYLGSNDFGVGHGSNLATLAISAEEPAVALAAEVADTLIPVLYDGAPYYLFAYAVGGG